MEKRVLSSRTIRVFAGLIDYIFLYSIAVFSLLFIFNRTLGQTPSEVGMKILTLFPLIFLGYCFKDCIYGISPGKYVVGIAVRDKDDFEKTPNFFLLFLRNITLIVWPIEILVLMFSKKKQRWGDLLAKTIVVRNHDVRLRYVLLRLFVILIIVTIAFAVSANVILKNFTV
ncbi:MAG: RDD family protein [Candidatus Omnitrophica bacterium]|nr:RDD family protein [Candidatus Omnitrophota bacterium]